MHAVLAAHPTQFCIFHYQQVRLRVQHQQEYQSADKRLTDSKPHDVLNKSAENYQQLVHRRSIDKGVSALQDQDNEENDTE